ncbi:MAG: hypothetical protein ACK5B6_14325, partial [Bacteroidia bacterium]
MTLNLSVSPTLTASEDVSICDAQLPYAWNGNSYNAAGTYTVTLQNAANCDSVVTLNLSVSPTLTASEDVSICDAQLPYAWNGNSYNAAGSYSVTLSTAAGCDSVVTLNLSVSPTLTASEDVSICDAQLPYSWNGNSYNAAGSYSATLSSAAGCDSVATLNLTVNSFAVATDVQSVCGSFTWIDGNTYNVSTNPPTFTLTNAAGCDSVITLNLTILPAVSSSTNLTICDAQLPYVWNGLTFTAAGSQSATLISAAGCDSVATLNLNVHQSFTSSISISICEGESYTLPDGSTVNASGNYTTSFTTQFGCDSTITTILTVDPQITLT